MDSVIGRCPACGRTISTDAGGVCLRCSPGVAPSETREEHMSDAARTGADHTRSRAPLSGPALHGTPPALRPDAKRASDRVH